MRRSEVKVGNVYMARVSGRLVRVRVDADRGTKRSSNGRSFMGPVERETHAGYDVTNLVTNRKLHITAGRLRPDNGKRCGTCLNCLTALAEKPTFAARIRAAREALDFQQADTTKAEWFARVAALPCLGAQ